jgi:hypothetical protein
MTDKRAVIQRQKTASTTQISGNSADKLEKSYFPPSVYNSVAQDTYPVFPFLFNGVYGG